MDLIFFASLKKLKKHGFNFLQANKTSKSMNLILASLKISQTMDLIFCKLKKTQKTWI